MQKFMIEKCKLIRADIAPRKIISYNDDNTRTFQGVIAVLNHCFDLKREEIERGIATPDWDVHSGMSEIELQQACRRILGEMAGAPRMSIKARLFSYLLDHAQLAVNAHDMFADRLNHGNILTEIRLEWQREAEAGCIREDVEATQPGVAAGVWQGIADYSHTTPDWERLLHLGVPGVLNELREAKEGHSDERALIFYEGCIETWEAILRLLRRMTEHMRANTQGTVARMAAELTEELSERAPQTFPEALKLLCVIYLVQNDIEGTLVRSLGRADQFLLSFYRNDLTSGRYTQEELEEMLRFFYLHFSAMNHPNNLPICFGGEHGVNELSETLRRVYDEMNLYCPKMQVRINEKLPEDFLRKTLDSIRRGNSSYVFVNDEVVVPGLVLLGVASEDAVNYVPVGCYEPMAVSKELPCTCAGTVNLTKLVELALNDGWDPMSKEQIGPHTGSADALACAEDFEEAVLKQAEYAINQTIRRVKSYESVLSELNPSPVYSAGIASCVESGVDAYGGGMIYNNVSINCIGLAGAVDSIMAVRRTVYEEGRLSLSELRDVLRQNWADAEALRLRMMKRCPKYGNGDTETDTFAAKLSDFCAQRINNVPNARGGVFRMGLFSVDWIFSFGERTGATPDGRFSKEAIAKNLSAVIGMDKQGPTALVQSVTMLDTKQAVNGAVLDVLIHPTAVQGEAGLNALMAFLKTFCRKGGQCIQFNVLDAEQLRRAQCEPEKYASLQVRVCGWNAYFVNLTREEQELFIRQAEGGEE